jgi:hypothetical protein
MVPRPTKARRARAPRARRVSPTPIFDALFKTSRPSTRKALREAGLKP